MKQWYSARELAGKPGMPGTERNVNARAQREGWDTRKRERGKGWEYSIHALPPRTQAALALEGSPLSSGRGAGGEAERKAGSDAKDGMDAIPAKDGQPSSASPLSSGREPALSLPKGAGGEAELWKHYERKPAGARAEAERRLKIVHAVINIEASGQTREAAIAAVSGECGVPRRTLFRWLRLVKGHHRSDWLPALAPAYVGRTATAECAPHAWEMFKADYLRLESPSAAGCYDRLLRAAKEQGWAVPSLSALLRRLKREVSVGARVLARQGEEALDKLFPAQERDKSALHALQAVNADGHQFDVFARWPDGTVSRPLGLFWQDIYSGKMLSWRVARSENAETVRLAFGDLVERWGVPGSAYLDNGRGFASKWITGRMKWRHRFKIKPEEPEGVLTQMGVAVHWVTPYRGQAKPIERAFRDFCDRVAKHPAFAGAYTGNTPLAKPENYASHAVPIADFLRVLESEVHAHNARPGRRAPVCAGRSFDETFAESYAHAPIRKASEEQRRLWLLAAEGVLAAPPGGHVHLFGNRYWTEALAAHAGTRVIVRFDPEALLGSVHVYRLDGQYIAEAECQHAAGFTDLEAARKHARAKRDYKRAQRTVLEAERKLTAADVAGLLPALGEPHAPASNVIAPLFRAPASPASPDPSPADREADERHDEMLRRASLSLWKNVL